MKILVVGEVLPWPETSGMPIRLSNVLRGLASLGDIDLFVLPGQDHWETPVVPPDVAIRRLEVMARPPGDFSALRRVLWWSSGRLPSHFVGRDYREVRSRYRDWGQEKYDLVWFSTLKSYVPLKPVVDAPAVVDFDDLEDRKIVERMALADLPGERRSPAVLRVLHSALTQMQARKNLRLWRDLQLEAARSADAVVVCNELDRQYLGVANAFVIPNGYDYQPRPVGRTVVGQPPTIVLAGVFRYPPNADAACYLVEKIAPLVRSRLPDLRIRLVGRVDERVQKLDDPPRTVVTGFVPDVRTELALADLIAVPIRFGGGTRIKILEGFAHRIPVVSTSKGAEGIDAAHGREIIIGDTPEAFADGCIRLLTDGQYRCAVVEAAHVLFVEKYRWDRIHGRIASLGERVALHS